MVHSEIAFYLDIANDQDKVKYYDNVVDQIKYINKVHDFIAPELTFFRWYMIVWKNELF